MLYAIHQDGYWAQLDLLKTWTYLKRKFYYDKELNRISFYIGIDALLNTLRCLNEKVGTYDEEEEFKLLEELLQSSQFRKAKEVHYQ